MVKFEEKSQTTITQNGLIQRSVNFLLVPLAAITIYSMIIPIIIIDIWSQVYQIIYFGVRGIPKISRKDYIVLDRYRLSKLTFLQKINCLYCEYVNGFLAWLKALANQTEIYSCAIKHSIEAQGQEHQKDFYEYEDYK